jgi:hypothetical protein
MSVDAVDAAPFDGDDSLDVVVRMLWKAQRQAGVVEVDEIQTSIEMQLGGYSHRHGGTILEKGGAVKGEGLFDGIA